MARENIFAIENNLVVPGTGWNAARAEARQYAQGGAGAVEAPLGHYVASMVIEHASTGTMSATAEAFMQAAQPPMTPEQAQSFIGAFLIQAGTLNDADELTSSLHRVIEDIRNL